MIKLSSKSLSVSVVANARLSIIGDSIGRQLHAHSRLAELRTVFPAIGIRQLGPARFIHSGIPTLVVKGEPFVEHSLAMALAGKRLDDIAHQYKVVADSVTQPGKKVDGRVLVACNEGSGTWGHWVGHILPQVLVFLEHCPDARVILPEAYFRASHSSFGQLALLAGISMDRMVLSRQGDVFELEQACHIDLLYKSGVFHPLAVEKLKALFADFHTDGVLSDYQVHKTAMYSFGNAPARPLAANPNAVFIARQDAGTRNITNMSDIHRVNLAWQVGEYQLKRASIAEQFTVWRGSQILIGVMGSDLTNMIMCKPGARLLVLSPSWFGDNFFYGLAAALGLEWNELFCHQMVDERKPLHASSFKVNPHLYEGVLAALLTGVDE